MHSDRFRFCFTLDTEPDDLWARRASLSFEHLPALPAFHSLLVDAGARPTYLTTSEVIEAPEGRRALESCLAAGAAEVGAHFHSWTREWPFPTPNLRSPLCPAMAHQLPSDVEERMMAYTCDALQKMLGVEARSHRGGRWSLGPSTVRAMSRCGITVDSTVTPGISWRQPDRPLLDGPDFRRTPVRPHWLAGGDERNRILELPVGAVLFPRAAGPLFRRSLLAQRIGTRLGREVGIRIGHRWLRPTSTSVADLRAILRSLARQRVPVWVFMIHSSEIARCTKLPTADAVRSFVERCTSGIRAAVDLGAVGATLQEAADWVRQTSFVS